MEQIKVINTNNISKDNEEDGLFCDRPFEEAEDGYIDERGFYTTPNGSFWDEDNTYFNHLGFDKNGGSYDKYGVYQPGPNYNEKLGIYKDQDDLFDNRALIDQQEIISLSLSKLKEQGKEDERILKKYEQPIEESDEDDDEIEKDKSDLTYDENDIKEAYDLVMENENLLNSEKKIQIAAQ